MLLIDNLAVVAGIGVAILVSLELLALLVRHLAPKTGDSGAFERSAVDRLLGPSRLVSLSVAEAIVLDNERITPSIKRLIEHAIIILIVLAMSWLAIRMTYVLEDLVLGRFRVDAPDNLRARRIQTQLRVLRRLVAVVIVVVAVAVILLSFASVRDAGAGLLASAGLVGIVLGIAAQSSITNLIAGIQIAVSQPIRIDDVVVVQGHWGRVEEINLNYVVVKIWDLRRLILPVSVLVNEPFENWTRNAANLLEWVHLELDYRTPIPALRERFLSILHDSPNWDGSVSSLQVTSAGPSTIQVRALMSARDSSAGWDLQCAVREQLIDFLQAEYPESLPRIRIDNGDPFPKPSANISLTE
ncbi:MAG: mechanosensitive ion channel [Actinomycetota bacterium]|nr:mechanosensitive ion channel [Actinomycetota bacterium]